MNIVPNPIPFNSEGPQPLLREIPAGAAYPVDVNEHSKLTQLQHLILTHLWSDKAPSRAALI